MLYCNKCGAVLLSDGKTCPSCSVNQRVVYTAQQGQPTQGGAGAPQQTVVIPVPNMVPYNAAYFVDPQLTGVTQAQPRPQVYTQTVCVYQPTPVQPKGNGIGKAITSLIMSFISFILLAITYSVADEAYYDYLYYINNYYDFGGLEYGFGGVAVIILAIIALPFYIIGVTMGIKAVLGYFKAKKQYGKSGVATLVLGIIALLILSVCTHYLGYSVWVMFTIF
jgi:hypothetical protein